MRRLRHAMTRWRPAVALGLMTAALALTAGSLPPAGAGTVLVPGAQAETDEKTVTELLAVFDQAEQAVKTRDLDGVMALYSEKYNYHGLKKSDIRKIWKDLFDNYKDIESTHLFTRIVSVGPGGSVEITCSGNVRAVSKTGNLRVPVDSWYGEVHYLVKEGGAWKIRGNLGDVQTVLPFGTAPHPLF
jgi:ketosteroid isomerase-like protein